MRAKLAVSLLLLVAATAAGAWWFTGRDAKGRQYVTQPADRGDIVRTISANGTLNPVTVVNVGTQISGTVHRIHADFNDRVKAGQILAELDPALIQAAIGQRTADLATAEANLKLAQAKHARTRELVAKGFVNRAQLDDAEKETAAAAAQVASAKAQLEREQVNLRYSVIRSPISGTVVARNVDVGQTVAATFQTPTLFQIAQDLRRMQIYTSVAEADVGLIRDGQPVRFAVDAFPEQEFSGTVTQVRLNPTVQQNVVTYNVVVGTDNDRGILLPGMTAHVFITLETREGVLRVPNATLRFRPQNGNGNRQNGGGGRNGGPQEGKSQRGVNSGKTVYRLDPDGRPQPVRIRTGASDNSYTEVLGGELREGDPLIVRQQGPEQRGRPSAFRFGL